MSNYRPADWYWQDEAGRIYSSRRYAVVAANDADLAAWKDAGNAPIPWPRDEAGAQTDAALADVLAGQGLAFGLAGYAAQKRFAVETGGIVFGGSPIATDRESQAMISGAFNLVHVQPDTTIRFKTGSGFVELDAAAVTAIATAVGMHVQDCFAREADAAAGIEGGVLTTAAEVDAIFA